MLRDIRGFSVLAKQNPRAGVSGGFLGSAISLGFL